MQETLGILKKYWGYDAFRKKQDDIIQSVIDGNDTLVLLPTGGGKSICYQIPGLLAEGVCLVISPLIALMQDQVEQLKKRGVKAVALTSGMSKREIDIQLDNAIYGSTKFLYVSPERLKSSLFRERFAKMNINLIAVDEAHCISEWGYDFRPAYLDIADLRTIKPDTTVMALTATATPEVAEDIQVKLQFKQPHLISDTFERTNITYNTYQSNNKLNRILEYLGKTKDSGIIYCSTRKGVKNLCKHLLDEGVSSNFYHGGLDPEVRKKRQQDWIENRIQVMVCTNAFGMGIDKPDVRFVLHYDIPQTIEAYFQEAGRAGRDGNPAETILFFEPSDIDDLKEKVHAKFPALTEIKQIYKALGSHFQLAVGSGEGETYEINLLDFCDRFNIDLITAYNSLKFLEIGGYLALSENFSSPSKLQIITDPKNLYQYQVKDQKYNKIIQFLLRTQMGVFEGLQTIDEFKIAKHTGVSKKDIETALKFLDTQEVVRYIPRLNGTYITFLTERLTESNLSLPAEIYHKRKVAAISKLNAMVDFLLAEDCTSRFLLNYFGEKDGYRCEKCNRCVGEKEKHQLSDIKKDIESYLKTRFNNEDQVLIQDLISALNNYSKDEILEKVRWMIDHDQLNADPLGKSLLKG